MGSVACVSSSGTATYSGCTRSNGTVLNVGSIVGIVIGSLVGIAVLIALIVLIYKLTKRNCMQLYPPHPQQVYHPPMNGYYPQQPMGEFRPHVPSKPPPYSEPSTHAAYYQDI